VVDFRDWLKAYGLPLFVCLCLPLMALGLWKAYELTSDWPLYSRVGMATCMVLVAPGVFELISLAAQRFKSLCSRR
jgi:hypothetical protein